MMCDAPNRHKHRHLMAIKNRGYKFRLYPSEKQKEFLEQSFGCQRFIWNTFLDLNKTSYAICGKFIFHYEMCKRLAELKSIEEFKFLNSVQSQSLQNTLLNLSEAIGNIKNENGFPNYKSKHYSNNSYTISIQSFEIENINNLYLSPPAKLEKILKKNLKQNPFVISKQILKSELGKFLSKNHKIAKHILDAGFSKLCRFIKYKSEWYGRIYHKINQFYPSSKTCRCCGNINEELKLKDRFWLCFDCFSWLDRDYNAAINILNQGKKELNLA